MGAASLNSEFQLIGLYSSFLIPVDMGQVKTLSEEEAENLCNTYLLMKAGDKAGLKEAAIKRGYQSKYLDENVIYNMTRFALDSDGPEVCVCVCTFQFIFK